MNQPGVLGPSVFFVIAPLKFQRSAMLHQPESAAPFPPPPPATGGPAAQRADGKGKGKGGAAAAKREEAEGAELPAVVATPEDLAAYLAAVAEDHPEREEAALHFLYVCDYEVQEARAELEAFLRTKAAQRRARKPLEWNAKESKLFTEAMERHFKDFRAVRAHMARGGCRRELGELKDYYYGHWKPLNKNCTLLYKQLKMDRRHKRWEEAKAKGLISPSPAKSNAASVVDDSTKNNHEAAGILAVIKEEGETNIAKKTLDQGAMKIKRKRKGTQNEQPHAKFEKPTKKKKLFHGEAPNSEPPLARTKVTALPPNQRGSARVPSDSQRAAKNSGGDKGGKQRIPKSSAASTQQQQQQWLGIISKEHSSGESAKADIAMAYGKILDSINEIAEACMEQEASDLIISDKESNLPSIPNVRRSIEKLLQSIAYSLQRGSNTDLWTQRLQHHANITPNFLSVVIQNIGGLLRTCEHLLSLVLDQVQAKKRHCQNVISIIQACQQSTTHLDSKFSDTDGVDNVPAASAGQRRGQPRKRRRDSSVACDSGGLPGGRPSSVCSSLGTAAAPELPSSAPPLPQDRLSALLAASVVRLGALEAAHLAGAQGGSRATATCLAPPRADRDVAEA